MTASIRPMIRRDRPFVIELLKATPEFKPAEVVVAEEVIDSYLFDPVESGYYIAVSEKGPGIVGYICYGPTPLTEGTWDIYWLAVAQSQQRSGIGSAFMRYAEEKIRKALLSRPRERRNMRGPGVSILARATRWSPVFPISICPETIK
ncbi:MAG: GNAT family N-acetyltransferase [Dehalococcoidia bacterium]